MDPIIPVPRSGPFTDPVWLFEPKHDGFRGLLYVTPTSCRFYSKRGFVLKRFADFCTQVREQLMAREAILDDEVVALGADGYPDFHRLMRGQGDLHYAAFDLLWLNGRDLRQQMLVDRKRRLRTIIRSTGASIVSSVMTVEAEGRALYEATQRLDLEGIVAKRKDDPYACGVTWYKIKNPAYTQMEGRGDLFHGSR